LNHPQCKICQLPNRHDLESALADGARFRPLARKYGVSYDSLWRHWRRHLSVEQKDRLKFGDAPVDKLRGMVAEEGISVLKDLNFARKSIIDALAAAPAQDGHATATLAGRLHENARIRGLISGELSKSPLVSITNNTQNVFTNDAGFVEFQGELIAALRGFPDARRAVLLVFERLEQSMSDDASQPTGITYEQETAA
jgi:Psq-like protein